MACWKKESSYAPQRSIPYGAQVGNVITMPISGLLCKYGFDNGWGSIFYVFGILGVLWFIGWMLLVYDTPSVHPRISKEELDYIQGSLTGQIRKDIDKHEKIPWLKFLTSMPVWAIIVAHSCADWGTYTLLTQIPTFMKEVLKLDIAANGLFSAIPYVGYWLFTNVAGFSADFIRKKNWLSTVAVRKSYQLVAMALSSAFLIATGYMDCTKSIWAVVFLTLAVSGAAFQYGGEMVNQVDIAPRYAGVLFGIANTVSTLTGIAAPYMVSSLTKNKTQSQWQMVFYITGGICIFGAIFFAIFGSGVVQPWAMAKEEDEEEDKEKVALEQEAAV
ncbi:PREDICTED: uncharacterized transporter slc-17.2-like isoform X2 [Priapulus caudatus]|uniref:Uncharacterized transporter slc-17.2-like isoform X2 n=1 Tax=Priapulus caudatus TaxID=37621 RepID=A0ABM1E0G8_PRICU|nr:PREDICTED: uncharacterized transporter slc-17.2-like isoform X2 [Priapulus caudatus]